MKLVIAKNYTTRKAYTHEEENPRQSYYWKILFPSRARTSLTHTPPRSCLFIFSRGVKREKNRTYKCPCNYPAAKQPRRVIHEKKSAQLARIPPSVTQKANKGFPPAAVVRARAIFALHRHTHTHTKKWPFSTLGALSCELFRGGGGR